MEQTWLPPDADPGWRPALVPVRGGADQLMLLRGLFVTFCYGLIGVGFVVAWLNSSEEEEPGGMPLAAGVGVVVAAGVLSLVASRLADRPLDCSSDGSLVASYRTRFMLRLALAESTALVGFVAFFLTGDPVTYPVGLVFTGIGFLRAAPTAKNLQRDQDELAIAGCGRPLIATLRNPA